MSSDTADRTRRDVSHWNRGPGAGMVMRFRCMTCQESKPLDGRRKTKRGWACAGCVAAGKG